MLFTIKVSLLLFALVVGIEPDISCWYRIPLVVGAVILEQILNAYTDMKWEKAKRQSPNRLRKQKLTKAN